VTRGAMDAAIDRGERAALPDQERDALDARPGLRTTTRNPEQVTIGTREQLDEADGARIARLRRLSAFDTMAAR